MTYEAAKAIKAELEARVTIASAAIRSVKGAGSGAMGLTPDAVKFSPEYQAAKRAYDKAHDDMRKFNATFLRLYGREYQAERRRRA
jgi:hypothetical protein